MEGSIQKNSSTIHKPRFPWRFFTLAFGISWLFWIPAVLTHQPVMTFPWILLVIAGGLGPALSELVLIFHDKDKTSRKDYANRVFDVRRISPGWFVVILFTCPLINVLAVLIDWIASGTVPGFSMARQFLAAPLSLIPYMVFLLLFGPLPEELGWRGYALDVLQTQYNAFRSSLVLGAGWVGWHLPLFFMQGTFQNEIGISPSGFGWFCLSTIASSILLTCIYNNTNRSTLSAILFHFMTNFSGEMFSLTPEARVYQGVLTVLLAAFVVILWGPATLAARSQRESRMAFSLKG